MTLDARLVRWCLSARLLVASFLLLLSVFSLLSAPLRLAPHSAQTTTGENYSQWHLLLRLASSLISLALLLAVSQSIIEPFGTSHHFQTSVISSTLHLRQPHLMEQISGVRQAAQRAV
jgi:hypothetical protein